MDRAPPGGRRSGAIGLRPAVAADSEFGFELHRAAMGDYVTAAWGWDEQLQRDFHARGWQGNFGQTRRVASVVEQLFVTVDSPAECPRC